MEVVAVVVEEDDIDATAQVAGNDGVDIEDGFVIECDVRIGFGVGIDLGVQFGIDEKTDRDEMVDADVKNKVGAWLGVVELAVCVATGVASEGGSVVA